MRDLRRIRPLKKVLITSTIPQEGKSTIAANLACALAHSPNEKTLLVEGDLRRPSLSQMFGIKKNHGLNDWLQGEHGPFADIYHLEEPGLWLLPAGDAMSNPIELLQSQKLPAMMEQLARWFDWIIIDSPPVLPLADTSVWMRLADGVLLVTRQGNDRETTVAEGARGAGFDEAARCTRERLHGFGLQRLLLSIVLCILTFRLINSSTR